MSDKPECELCGDSGTMFYPNGGPWGAGARGKCPHLDGGKTSEKYRIAAGLRKAATKDEVVSVMVGGHRMSDLTPEQAARKQGKVALVLDELGVLFYIELFHEYNVGRTPRDTAVADDEDHLRREYELMFREDTP